MARKLTPLVVLLVIASLHACSDPEEICTCTCTCGSGAKDTIAEAENEDDCSSRCDTMCGNDSFTTNYDCTTQG